MRCAHGYRSIMVEKITRETIDDIDGTSGAQTVLFGWNSRQYEIDLGDKNRQRLEDALRPFVDAARESTRDRRKRAPGPRSSSNLAAIREWAKSNGYDVSDRGRVPAAVRDAYEAKDGPG